MKKTTKTCRGCDGYICIECDRKHTDERKQEDKVDVYEAEGDSCLVKRERKED